MFELFNFLIDSTNCIVSDSLNIEYGFIEYKLMHETETALFEIRKRDTSSVSLFKLMGVELMNEKPGIEYTSIGVNGASFESYNRCTLFEKQLSLYQPDLLSFQSEQMMHTQLILKMINLLHIMNLSFRRS